MAPIRNSSSPIKGRTRPQLHRTHNACLAGLLFAGALIAAEPPAPAHVRNFGQVDATLYRGAAPSPVALQELQRFGVRLILDLRESGEATLRERDQVQQLGMQYVNIQLRPFSAPTNEQMQRVLALLTNRGAWPAFVHCRRGKDRTGTAVACYRIEHDGWSNRKALAEAESFGMSWTERGMRSFILHFSPFAATVTVQP